jgi:hypothetical protein
MRRNIFMCLIGLLAVLASRPSAANRPAYLSTLGKVDRTIRREPTYQTKQPRYCLLVFGPEARYHIWLVLDGDTLYVDRNGNGDLTEPGKSTRAMGTNTEVIEFEPMTIFRPDGKTEEKLTFVLYGWFDYRAGKYTSKVNPAVHVQWKGRSFGSWGDVTGPCVWGTSPQNAPVLLIDGPLQMGFEEEQRFALMPFKNATYEVSVGVGTSGLGQGAFVHLCYTHNAIPGNVHPKAVLEFPNSTPGGPPIVRRVLLNERC